MFWLLGATDGHANLDDDGFVPAPDGLGLEVDRDALADRRISVD